MATVPPPWWQSCFESVRFDDAAPGAAGVILARTELVSALGLPDHFALPPLLVEMLELGVTWCSRTAGDRYTEFGWLGTDMAGFYRDYEFGEYMPSAIPLALDGGGGFYLLDARTGRNDGRQEIVWSHSGSLGWDLDDHRPVAPDFETLVRDGSLT